MADTLSVQVLRKGRRKLMGTKRMGFCAGALACALVAAPILVSTGMARVATTASAASTPSASVTGFSVTPGTTGPGAFDLAVKDLPSSAFAPSSGATDTPVAAIGVGHTGVGHTGVGHTGVGHTGVGHTGVGHTALNFLGVGHTGVGHTGVGHTDVVDAAFGSMLIADLTIAYPHGCALTGSTTQCTNWEGIRAGTPLQDLPPQSVSLRDIINDATAFARFSTLTLDDIDISNTPLNDLPIAAVALANIPLSHLVIDPLHTDRVGTLKAWCAALAALPTGSNIDCKNDVNADPATFTTSNIDTFDDITLMTIALGGADFSQLPLDSIVVTGNPNNPSAGQVLAGSPLGGALVGTNNIADPNNPTTNLFEPDVTLADIGVGHTDLGDTGVGHTGVGHTGVGHTGVGHTDINALGVGHTGVGHTDLDAAGVGHTGVGHTGVGHTGVGHTAVGVAGPGAVTLGQMTLNANGLGGILLSHLDLTTAGLDGILLSDLTDPTPIVVCGDGTGATVVCATATLGQAAAAGALQPRATLLALQAALTPASTSLASFNAIKSGILISAIPPTAAEYDSVTFTGYISEIPQGLLDTSPYQMTLADFFAQADQFGVFWSLTSDIDASVTSIVVKGTDTPPAAPFDTFIGGELVHVTAVDNSAAPTRTFTVVRGANGSTAAPHVAGTPVFAGVDVELGVLLQGISVTDQNRRSLQELFDNLPADILAKTDLADLLSAISAQTHVTLDNLLLALIGQLDLPWEQVNLGAVQLQTSDTTNPVTLKATAALSVTDDGNGSLQNVDVVATIPADYAYSPLSAMLGATALAEPAVGGGTNGITLTWSLRAVPASTPSLTFKVQPGLVFGTETLSAEAHLTGGTAGTSKSADVTVNNSGAAASTNPGSPTSITPDTLYLGHLTPQATSNFYSITVTGGERVSLLLGNLPGDYDLILYDAAGAVTHLRGTPDGSVLPISDPPPSLTPAEDALPPEPLQDLAVVPGLPVHEVAQHRGVTDEEIDTGTLPAGTYLVQVAGYDGANSGLPYSLRARVITDPAASCPASVTPYTATPSVAYTGQASATPPATADTVVLWDPARFDNTWGTAALSSLYTSMNHFMSTYGKAVLINVESDSATRSAYTAWDNNRCNVDLANAVVQAIGRQIDTVLGASAGIKYLTMIGADDQIPMARVRDATRVANERGRSGDFGDANQIAAAMGGRCLLSDDVYTQQHPLAVGGRDLYTPELAIGRLVDEPVEIQKALDDFANAQGHLPSSAKSLVTGYDFLSDGANAVANALAGHHGPVDSLINPTWTADDLATALLTPDAQNRVPGIASLNAHFDEQNILPAAGNSDKSNSELLTFLDVKRRGTTTSLQGALLFGMGCHGGLELPDSLAGAMGRSVSQTGDWTQLMAQQGAVWIANTGYGYGDTDVNALSEQLMTLLADQLDRSTTIGDALRVAKQRYRAGLSVLSAYDEKVMQEATFYGFPMWSLGAPTQVPVVLPTAGGVSDAVDVAGLRVAQFSHTYDPSAAGSF